jgi:heat shock protein HtpX
MTTMYNNFKTAMLLGALMALFVAVGRIWGMEGMIMGLILGGVMNVIAFFFSDRIAIASMRGQEVNASNAPELYHMVDRLRQQAGLPMPKVYVCPHDAPNAFATGRSPSRAAVAVTQGCDATPQRAGARGRDRARARAHQAPRHAHLLIAATIAGVLAFLAQWGFSSSPRVIGTPTRCSCSG